MTALAPFVDAEAALIELLAELATADVQTPPTLEANLPFIRVIQLGGLDDRWNAYPRVDVDCYAAQRSDAKALAEAVHQRLLNFPFVTGAGVIDKVETDVMPNEVPWANAFVRRFTAAYKVSVRR